MKIKGLWIFERAVFLSKTLLLFIAVRQIRHCRLRCTRCSPNVENIKICFGFFSECIRFFFLEEDRILKGLAVNSLIAVAGHRLSSGGGPRPVIYATVCSTCRVCFNARGL